jgi:SAM-dependent methyltransferase
MPFQGVRSLDHSDVRGMHVTTALISPPLAPPQVRPAPRATPPTTETAAQVYDLLSPLVLDFTPFTEEIAREVRAWPGQPRVYEFGCGAGHVTLSLLAARPDVDYHGFDWSAGLVGLLQRKVRRLPAGTGRVAFTAPCVLTTRDVSEPVRGMRADLIVVTDFLAHVRSQPDDGSLHRVAFLSLCRQLLKPGGLIFVLEQVHGESVAEQRALTAGWERIVQTRMRERLQTLYHAARERDPDFDGLLGQVVREPGRLRGVRQELGAPEPEGLPLSAWHRLFQHHGVRCRTVPHPTLRDFYMFVIRP